MDRMLSAISSRGQRSAAMRVLVTNATLTIRSGTDTYIRDLGVTLRRLGHEVAVYSNLLGQSAGELRALGIPVVDHLAAAPWTPDILHCHHNMEAMTALLHFPFTPAVFVAHSWMQWLDVPVCHPRVFRYVAVDAPTRDALVRRYGIPGERVRLIPNFVDLDRFTPRGPLPKKPRRALVLSHYAREDTHLPVVREACERRGLSLDVIGYGAGRPDRSPERRLGDSDIVFAKGRAALEATVVGAAVVVCDSFGVGPMITTKNAPALRTLEGDYTQWYSPLGVASLLSQIDRYDPDDVSELTRWARTVAAADRVVPELVSLYQEAAAEFADRGTDQIADARAGAVYLAWLSRHVKEHLVERDPFAGFAVRLRNRLTRSPLLAFLLLRISARLRARWPLG
jgi:glycosyltransferase involved in cell wall biosynthesis